MNHRTYVFIAKDLGSKKRKRKVLRVAATDNPKEDMRKAISDIKTELLFDPQHMWQLDRVWQILNGGKQ